MYADTFVSKLATKVTIQDLLVPTHLVLQVGREFLQLSQRATQEGDQEAAKKYSELLGNSGSNEESGTATIRGLRGLADKGKLTKADLENAIKSWLPGENPHKQKILNLVSEYMNNLVQACVVANDYARFQAA